MPGWRCCDRNGGRCHDCLFYPEELARANNVSIMIFSLPVQRTGREKPVDYVGLLKVQTTADVGLDSDSAHLFDMMQRIFSSATRRELPRKHLKGGRRGGELKIDWTNPPD